MDSASKLQQMPSAPMAEKSVLSVIFGNFRFLNRSKAEGVDTDCFYDIRCRTIWEFINKYQSEYPDTDELDAGIVIQSLNINGGLERAGGMGFIGEIITYAAADRSFLEWCGMLREMKARRLAKTHSTKLDECEDSEEAIFATKEALEQLQRTLSGKQRAQSGKVAAEAFLAKFQADHQAGEIPGASTGIYDLDKANGGMRPGEFWVICGKPSMGKSVLMIQIASAFAARGDVVALFSLEMMQSEVIGRLVTVTNRVRYGCITQPRTATKPDFEKIKLSINTLKESKMWIDDSAGQTIDTIANEAELIRDREGSLSLVVVDYIQLIRGGRAKGESREEEVARVSGGLKQLAKRLACPVISASQLNEDNKTRESRAIEQDADVLIGIADDGLKVGKMRNSKKGQTIELFLDGELQIFQSLRKEGVK